jgi:cell division septum initiation protein DivIVA
MTPGLCLDSGEFIPAAELNMTHKFETKRPKEHPPVMIITDENEMLRQRISELEAKIAQLTESLETASSAVIVLKQQQREGWAQISSGQEPTGLCVDWLSNVIRQADGNNNLGAGALAEKIVEAVNKLQQAHPKPAQPVPLTDELAAERERFCAAIKAADDEASDND